MISIPNTRIGFFTYKRTQGMDGGDVYSHMLVDALTKKFSVSTANIRPWFARAKKPQQLLRTRQQETGMDVDLWIREPLALAAMCRRSGRASNIALIHHVDNSESPHPWFQAQLTERVLRKARSCDVTVVVADYWKRFLDARGTGSVRIIHNGFDIQRIQAATQGADAFRRKHGLGGKPLLYIGNARHGKGVRQVYSVLRQLDVQMVTSGIPNVELPVRHFQLGYSDYIRLLAACDVVITMSTFLEGWNRTAHEAMLCRTPVIGSGAGGMLELLQKGGQLVCQQLELLPQKVACAMAHADALGKSGFRFASGFTLERFSAAWNSLIEEVRTWPRKR